MLQILQLAPPLDNQRAVYPVATFAETGCRRAPSERIVGQAMVRPGNHSHGKNGRGAPPHRT